MTDLSKIVFVIMLFIMFLSVEGSAIELESSRVIPSSQILAQIRNSTPVEYTNIEVMGDLDLSNISEPVTSPITIKDSEFHGVVIFNDSIIKEPINFERTLFLKPAYFFQTRFMEGVNFNHAQFNETAIFRKSLINQAADFGEARFNGRVDFRDSIITAEIADFGGAYFDDDAQFIETGFSVKNANFEWSQFNKSAKFWHSVFGEYADFRGAHFGDIADFYVVQFNDTADFWGAQFEKELFFNDVSFKIFRIQWASIEGKLNCNGPPYLLLIKNFKDLEQFEDADSCYYQYRDWRRTNRPLEWAIIGDYVSWLSCGYGVRWHYTIFSSIMVIMLFGLYYESFNFRDVLRNLSNERGQKNTNQYEFKENLKRAITFSAITLLSLPSDWYPFGKDEYAQFIKQHLISAIFERIVGWGLMLLLIGTLSRLMVRY